MFGASPAIKRYNRRVIWLSLGYAALLFAAVALFSRGAVHGPLAYLVAILPAVPQIAIFMIIGRYLIEETDEYLRDRFVRQLLIATGFALSVTTAWGFLENFGLVPHVYAYYTAVLWFAGIGIGALVNRLAIGRET
ncbi:hypothetical protein [Sphingomonas alpina]|uniref:Uncharacterized protein n=1 Tax=Sphingomonas alpina TaxID=653931 RepID=A0A7H0LJX1_9SPHN|nr:hypothetical protein [Sphingomonas alpina]QNQ09974.1 hypothetical protein H3Z74_01595 [Sphingomonas alpina]